ncbi:Nitrate reductase [Striga hermonthica]|uniref:Nitrate reductase n=1 Tax=Striga hermonthica TaxID=68872 RepID=A0A9N7NFN8_STRHE|nr:Nitrate reductase [Striga hermonthica]
MAASVENRQFPYLEPGIPRPFKPSHRFPSPPVSAAAATNNGGNTQFYYSSSSSDDEDNRDKVEEYLRAAKKAGAELEPPVRDDLTADGWIDRDPSMIRLTGKHPFNAEPPLTRLMHHGFITPAPLHYVRNHGPVPPATWDDWTVEVTGLVKRPARFTMHQLVTEFPSRELPVTLVCAGNRRKEQNMVRQTVGFNWGAAGVSTSVWRGVPLRAVLRRCGVKGRCGGKGAMNVCFEGAEDLPGGGGSKYGTSLRREVAMDPSRDIILAYMQNGERLSPDHGFPVRVIIPGFIGGRMVKWLRRIVVTTHESDNYYHYRDNRVLPSHVDAELANAEAWWYKPEYIINELNINSVITTPCHEEILPINSFTTQRPYTLKGYAYSGGGKKVTRVEVTMDGGETWRVCELDHPEKPNKYGKYWCWCFWSLEVEVLDLLSAKEIAVRAWDETLNTQPEKLIWNVMGMMNNCWFRVKTNVCKPHRGEIGIVFEHPTQPGNQSGGWMAKERHLEQTSGDLKKSLSSPFMNTTSKTYSMAEVKKHNSPDSAWIVVHGHVYDCTPYLRDHPGGADSILINAGTDCTEEFDAIHSDRAKKLLEGYRVGELLTAASYTSSPDNSLHGPSPPGLPPINEIFSPVARPTTLDPRERVSVKLVSKTSLSHNVRLLRFSLPGEYHVLGLPVGKHVLVCAEIDGKLCMRAYTPTSDTDSIGHFDLVVKVYFRGVHPKFPNGGAMSQYLDSLQIGQFVKVKGPLGHIEYLGRGRFVAGRERRSARKLAMIAGGTGITPIYQVMRAALKDPEDTIEMHVVYANRTEDDILLRDELDSWARRYPDRVKVWYVVQESVRDGWEYSVGFVTEEILREHIPAAGDETLVMVCGPPAMMQFAVNPSLEKMGFDLKKSMLVF